MCLSGRLLNVAKGAAYICVVKNVWITMENGSKESPECMLHIIKQKFSESAKAESEKR